MPIPNVFSGPYLDRAAHLRKDDAFIAAALRDSAALIVPVWKSRSLVRRGTQGCCAEFVTVTHEFRRDLADSELVMLGR
ncbi:MAG TPA: hypothetical protein VLH36_14845, partial [Steroidobacteraceae bacterium]|nr:hypothetical protein [Steroidobacteraceae bacterium]